MEQSNGGKIMPRLRVVYGTLENSRSLFQMIYIFIMISKSKIIFYANFSFHVKHNSVSNYFVRLTNQKIEVVIKKYV